jgi:hypothetical protein
MTRYLKSLLALLVLLLAACAGPRYSQVAASAPALKPGEGRIYVYTGPIGLGNQPRIRVNGQVVGRSKPGSFFYLDRPAGSYVITSKLWTSDGLSFILNAGETRYVSLSAASMGSSGYDKPGLTLVDPPSEAERQLLPLHYWGAALPQ